MDLPEAIRLLNPRQVRKFIDSGQSYDNLDEFNRSLLHIAVEVEPIFDTDETDYRVRHSSAKSDIIYMLVDAGVDLELKDKDGKTCLWYAVENCDLEICTVLLQCGADMHCEDEEGISILDQVFSDTVVYKDDVNEDLVDDLQDVFEIFYPGLWKAVESRDICQTRRLTNLWCKTNLAKNGKTLKDLALDSGHEEIISLIFGIHDTMKLIHHLYAQNTDAVTAMLTTSRKSLQLDLRKMSERGAPILYYLIQWNDKEMIQLFVKHGCHVYTIMRDEYNCDMPVLFSALEQNVPSDVMRALLPTNKSQQEEMLYKLLYKGRTILEVALGKKSNLDVFDVIVDRGGPLLLMDRNELNQNVRDLAVKSDKKEYADIIDKNVSAWILEPEKYPGRRQALALYGYNHIKVINENEMALSNSQAKEFMDQLDHYQDQIARLINVTEEGDLVKFINLQEYVDEHHLFEKNLSWDGRRKGDGMPLLHRAVLFNRPQLVKAILEQKPASQSVDTLFDQHHRTAMHYASACSAYKEVRKLLLNSGCSEHVLDRQNREPLDFRDKKDTPIMMDLLERLKAKEYLSFEPDPWDDDQKKSNCNQHYNPSYIFSPTTNTWTCNSETTGHSHEETCDDNCTDDEDMKEETDSEPEEQGYSYCTIS